MKRQSSLFLIALTLAACKAPVNNPTSVTFTDSDPSATLGGDVVIGRAVDEKDITSYRLRWGSTEACVAIENEIAVVNKSAAGDLIYHMPAGTEMPSAAEHILVFAKNAFGENPACASVEIQNNEDVSNPPANPPVAISFTDNDGVNTIGGPVTITPAVDEFDITHYVLRFGNNGCNVGATVIADVAKTGSTIVYQLPQGTTIPAGATQILAYSKNGDGEMPDCQNAAATIEDYIAPTPPSETAQAVSFNDIDDLQTIGGTIAITKAIMEDNISTYVLRWGNSAGCNISGNSQLAELAATGSNLTYSLPANTTIPSEATQILVYSKNSVGEMADCNAASTTITNMLGQWVTLRHGSSGECMQAPEGTGQLFVDACNIGNTYQRWELIGSGSNYQLRNVGSGRCAHYNAPWNFQAENCSGTSYQSMNFGDPSGSWYEISNSYWAGTSCMFSAAWGANIEGTLGNCGLGGDIEWQVRRLGSIVLSTPFLPM